VVFVPLDDAVEQTGYSKASLYRFARERRIALVKIGARTGVLEDELHRFLAASIKPFRPGERVIGNAGGRRQAAAAKKQRTRRAS
jgi:hypothetical protein